MTGANPEIIDELLQNTLDLQHLALSVEPSDRLGTDELVDVIRHGPVLEALLDGPMDRRDIEAALDVSRATSHRFTRWLTDRGYAERVDGRFGLTGQGATAAEAVLQFERKLRTADRLAPLLDIICEDHQEFVVEPFDEATVTVATPADPYAPVARFLSLLRGSETFRGFNTTHMVPPTLADDLFDGREVELVYLPSAVESLRAADPERFDAAIEAGHLTLRTREVLPYGLALFDDRVGIGGYDEETGAMRVFVDADTAIAREWAERVYATYRDRSEPLGTTAEDDVDSA